MNGKFYVWTRDLHLYIGLAISPLVLLFAISVISSQLPRGLALLSFDFCILTCSRGLAPLRHQFW
jgi:hypothetical protein